MQDVKDDNISVTDLVKPLVVVHWFLTETLPGKTKIHQVDQINHHDRTKETKDLILFSIFPKLLSRPEA